MFLLFCNFFTHTVQVHTLLTQSQTLFSLYWYYSTCLNRGQSRCYIFRIGWDNWVRPFQLQIDYSKISTYKWFWIFIDFGKLWGYSNQLSFSKLMTNGLNLSQLTLMPSQFAGLRAVPEIGSRLKVWATSITSYRTFRWPFLIHWSLSFV